MWIGTAEIAGLLGCSRRLVQQSFREADRVYGAGNWRDQSNPIARKRVYQVRRARVHELIRQHDKAITKEEDSG